MIQAESEEVVDRRPAEVFDFVADVTNEPAWNPDLLSVPDPAASAAGPVGVGSTRSGEYRHIGTVRTTVVEYERPTRLAYVAKAAHAEMTVAFQFEPADGDATRMRVRGTLRLAGPLRLVERSLRGTVARQYADRAVAIKRAIDARSRRP
jgi:carbon monoxide dehydrogenase subunit G